LCLIEERKALGSALGQAERSFVAYRYLGRRRGGGGVRGVRGRVFEGGVGLLEGRVNTEAVTVEGT
jgi:hypothetical protein